MKRWAHGLVFSVLAAFAVVGCVGGCSEKDLTKADKIVAEANEVGTIVTDIAESPVGQAIPFPIRSIMAALGLGLTSAYGVWQKIRAGQLATTGKVLTRAIESTGDETKAAVKQAVKAEAERVNETGTVKATVTKLKAS